MLERLRRQASTARIGFLLSPRDPARPIERARAVGAEALHPWGGLVTRDLIEAAHAEGLAVYPYTVDTEDDMRRLLDLGVDGLFTNYPDRLRALVDFPVGDGS